MGAVTFGVVGMLIKGYGSGLMLVVLGLAETALVLSTWGRVEVFFNVIAAPDRVYVYDERGELVSLPVEWTDLAPEDPFVVIAAGRSAFRVEDLLALADLVDRLRPSVSNGDPRV